MIRFRYQPTLASYQSLNFYFLRRQAWFLYVIAALCVASFVVSPFLGLVQQEEKSLLESYYSRLGVLILPGILGALLIATWYAAKKRWNAAEELREEKEYEIDETGVRVKADSFSGFLEWHLIVHAELKNEFFYLRTGQNQFHYFPASAVPDKAALLELIGRKVGSVAESVGEVGLE